MPNYKTIQLKDEDHAKLSKIRNRLAKQSGLPASYSSTIMYGLKLIELKLDEDQAKQP